MSGTPEGGLTSAAFRAEMDRTVRGWKERSVEGRSRAELVGREAEIEQRQRGHSRRRKGRALALTRPMAE